MEKAIILFLIGIFIGYYGHLYLKKYLKKTTQKVNKKSPNDLDKLIKEKECTIDLLNQAIKQKKDEKYFLVNQNIELRRENQDLIDLRKTTEELREKARLDGMKIYIPEKDKKKFEKI